MKVFFRKGTGGSVLYLHIGNDFVLNEQDLIGVFDLDHITASSTTMTYLKALEDDNRLVSVSDELPKSLVIAVNGGVEIGYLSPLAARTIQNRQSLRF